MISKENENFINNYLYTKIITDIVKQKLTHRVRMITLKNVILLETYLVR